jgi:hypothetical protein
MRRAGLAALIALAFSSSAWASIGYVQFASGGALVTGSDGVERVAVKGLELNAGDTIDTREGRAQVRFSDGSYVSLQPKSVFQIKDYRFEGKTDGSEKGVFSLIKGGLRTITGLIGRVNRDNYEVETPVAIIGIRGTEYLAALGDSLTVSVGEGRVAVTNETGEFVAEAGQSIHVADQKSRPQVTSEKAFLPPEPVQEGFVVPAPQGFVAGEQVNALGEPLVVAEGDPVQTTPPPPVTPPPVTPPPVTPPPGQGNPFIVASGDFPANQPNQVDQSIFRSGSGRVSCDSSGACDQLQIGSFLLNNVSAQVVDNGFDVAVGWGRWTNGRYTAGGLGNTQLNANQGLHYVYGVPTAVADLPQSATYSLLGATQATSLDGSLGLGTFSARPGTNGVILSADFTAGTAVVDFQVQFPAVNNGPITYTVTSQALNLSGATFAGAGLTATGSGCGAGCSTSVDGFFAGPGAARAGLGYQITGATTTVSGAAALARN